MVAAQQLGAHGVAEEAARARDEELHGTILPTPNRARLMDVEGASAGLKPGGPGRVAPRLRESPFCQGPRTRSADVRALRRGCWGDQANTLAGGDAPAPRSLGGLLSR